jgi:arginase family enzyme
MQIKIIDIDGSLTSQTAISRMIEAGAANLIDAKDFASSTRIFARKKTIQRFVERVGAPPENEPEVCFYGSGDFHHLTAALVSRFSEPLTIIHFDNHPDWVTSPKTFNCGAWVNRALEMPHVERIITLGVMSNDLKNPESKSANLAALQSGKLEVFPWNSLPSKVKKYYGIGASYGQLGRYLNWQDLSKKNWTHFLNDLMKTIPTQAIYISIDKDVLGKSEATTNWDQGAMPLSHITTAITALATKYKILGIDVCGDYSPVRVKDPIRRVLAFFDHPKRLKPNEEKIEINNVTNQKLIYCFRTALHEAKFGKENKNAGL